MTGSERVEISLTDPYIFILSLVRSPFVISRYDQFRFVPPCLRHRGGVGLGHSPATGSGCGPRAPRRTRPRRLSAIRPIKKALTAKLDMIAKFSGEFLLESEAH
jgi:hypothetical protein